jgi:secondary-alcohol dehydrogenase (coenzyme-F420)
VIDFKKFRGNVIVLETKIGYFDSIMWNKPKDAVKYAVLAENVGFDDLWVDDHFHPTFTKDAQCGFAWSWMGSALEATKNIPIGTAVTCPTIRYNPVIVAQAFATMAQMYPGRVMLGLGAGEAISEAAVTGKWPTNPERQAMLVEAVDMIKKLWAGKEPLSFKGDYYTTENAFMYTRPEKEPPIYYSGMGPKGSKLAGKWGDHLITVFGSPEMIKNVTIPAFEEGAKEAGKNPDNMEKSCFASFTIDPDYDKAVESLKNYVGCTFPFWMKYKVTDPKELDFQAERMSNEAIAEHSGCIIATDTEEFIKQLEPYKKAGINHFILGNNSPTRGESINAFKEIIPQLK